jgi:hypothetical protein
MKKGRKRKKGVGSGSITQRYGSRDPDPDPYQNATDPQHCSEEPGSSTNLIPLVAGAWRTSMWWGRAMVSRGPDPSLTQLKVMVAWSPDELALTYYTHCGLRFVRLGEWTWNIEMAWNMEREMRSEVYQNFQQRQLFYRVKKGYQYPCPQPL